MFDSKILPTFHYGSKVWSFHEGKNVELSYSKYYKFMLGVNKSVPNIAVLGELGRTNLITLRYSNIIRYWLKHIQMNSMRIAKNAYELQYKWAEKNEMCWALQVKQLNYYHMDLVIYGSPKELEILIYFTYIFKQRCVCVCVCVNKVNKLWALWKTSSL